MHSKEVAADLRFAPISELKNANSQRHCYGGGFAWESVGVPGHQFQGGLRLSEPQFTHVKRSWVFSKEKRGVGMYILFFFFLNIQPLGVLLMLPKC